MKEGEEDEKGERAQGKQGNCKYISILLAAEAEL